LRAAAQVFCQNNSKAVIRVAIRRKQRLVKESLVIDVENDAGIEHFEAIATFYDQREFGKAIREIMDIADKANQYVDLMKPWELAKDATQSSKLQEVCTVGIILFRHLTVLLKPICQSGKKSGGVP